MRRQLLFATLLTMAYAGSAAAFDQMSVPADSYKTANAPTGDADSSAQSASSPVESNATTSSSTGITAALNHDEVSDSAPSSVPANDNDAPDTGHPAHVTTSPAAPVQPAPAPPHKSKANVHWQSLLPGVMK